jgi:hypothetical protein
VGIENTEDFQDRSTRELGSAAHQVRRTLADLAISDEALFPMNYLQAAALWTTRPEARAAKERLRSKVPA